MTQSQVNHSTVDSYMEGRRERRDFYKALIEYRYNVDGRTYTGSRISFLRPGVHGERESYEVVSNHPEGGKVTVFFNPRDPADAVIERNLEPPGLLSLALLCCGYLPAAAVLGVYLYVLSMVRRARRRLAAC